MQELGNHHVDILVFLFPSRTEETEVLSSFHTNTLHTSTEAVSGYSKVTRGVEKLGREREKGEREREREDGERYQDASSITDELECSLDWRRGDRSLASAHSYSAPQDDSQQ